LSSEYTTRMLETIGQTTFASIVEWMRRTKVHNVWIN